MTGHQMLTYFEVNQCGRLDALVFLLVPASTNRLQNRGKTYRSIHAGHSVSVVQILYLIEINGVLRLS